MLPNRFRLIISISLLLFNVALSQDSKNYDTPQLADTIKVDSASTSGFWLWDSEQNSITQDYIQLFYAITFFIIAFLLIIYLRQPLQKITERSKSGARRLTRIIPIFLIIAWLIVFIVIARSILDLSFQISYLLLLIIGLAIALASQGILKDVIAGLIVPFEIHLQKGNKIRLAAIYGEIVQIGIRKVVVQTADGQITLIPNHYLLNDIITNIYSNKDNYPVCVDFYLPQNSDLGRCKETVYKAAIVSPYLFLEKPVEISFSHQLQAGRLLIRLRVQAYLRQIQFERDFISDLTETVSGDILNASDIADSQSESEKTNH